MVEKELVLRGLNGNQLKLIAVVTMIIDHIAYLLLGYGLLPNLSADLSQYQTWRQIYLIMRCIGRIAFPLYAFLLVEGIYHTKNWRIYAFRIAVFAIISEIPFDLMAFAPRPGQTINWMEFWTKQNVLFTLLIGILTLEALRFTALRQGGSSFWPFLVTGGIGCVLASLLKTDYDCTGIILLILLYLFHKKMNYQCIVGFIWMLMNNVRWINGFGLAAAFLIIYVYNGGRGKKTGRKYMFYFIYPAHILILYGIFCWLF